MNILRYTQTDTMKIFLISSAFFLLGLILIGSYSLFTKNLFIESRVLKTPLGRLSNFSLSKAPGSSIRGTIASLSGTVLWESRTATHSSPLFAPREIQQGESIETKDNSEASLQIPRIGNMKLMSDTSLSIVQTLPSNSLIEQKQGNAVYTKAGQGNLSIRCMGLLLKILSGSVTISVDSYTSTVTIATRSDGTVLAAYNDADYVSKMVTIPNDSSITYDDITRTTTLE